MAIFSDSILKVILNINSIKIAESSSTEFEFQINVEDFIIEEENKFLEINKLIVALDKIPPRHREILSLRFYSKLEYADISSLMGITYQVARNQLSYAVTRVKTIISENS